MKKYFLKLAAIVLAIGFTAFSGPLVKKPDTNILYFQGSYTSASQVVDLTKWTSQSAFGCGAGSDAIYACKILWVSDTYTHDTTIAGTTYQTPNRLGSTLPGESEFGTITAAVNTCGSMNIYYVSSASQGTILNGRLTCIEG